MKQLKKNMKDDETKKLNVLNFSYLIENIVMFRCLGEIFLVVAFENKDV